MRTLPERLAGDLSTPLRSPAAVLPPWPSSSCRRSAIRWFPAER